MRNDDRPEFVKLLGEVMVGYAKPMPDAGMVKVWWDRLLPHRPEVIAQAFQTYMLERPDFAPTPVAIAARCMLLDGRPSADEAWGTVLLASDENNTVLWTREMAQANGACKAVLDAGDKIGARRTFIEAYDRMVSAARAAGEAPVWTVSPGRDKEQVRFVTAKGIKMGLLPAPAGAVAALLGHSEDEEDQPERWDAATGLARIKEAVAQLENPADKLARIAAARAEAERVATAARKQEIEQQVQQHQHGDPAA